MNEIWDVKKLVDSSSMEEHKKRLVKLISKSMESIKEEFLNSLYNFIQEHVEEIVFVSFEDVRYAYFNGIVNFLLGSNVRDPETLKKWLSDIGYTEKTLRRKIFEENKEEIISSITEDAFYEAVDRIFDNGYFRSFEFTDIYKNYPQSKIVINFVEKLAKVDGFSQYVIDILDKKIRDKLEYLEKIKKCINQLEDEH